MYGCNAGADLNMLRGGVYIGGYPIPHWVPAPYPILQPTHLPTHPIDTVRNLL